MIKFIGSHPVQLWTSVSQKDKRRGFKSFIIPLNPAKNKKNLLQLLNKNAAFLPDQRGILYCVKSFSPS